MQFKAEDIGSIVQQFWYGANGTIAEASTKAVIRAGTQALLAGQADIRAAGFSKKWTDTYKLTFYQVDPPQVDAAAWLYHKILYANVFQDGAVIHGKPLLWIPLRNAPRNFGRGHITPGKLAAKGVPLFTVNRPGSPPLMGTKVYGARGGRTNFFNISVKRLKDRTKKRSNQVLNSVMLFFGVTQVTIRKKFHLKEIGEEQVAKLEDYYNEALKVD